MEFLVALWMPILLSAVVLFVISAMAWMVLPHHREDFGRLASEDDLLNRLRELNIQPGRYSFPYCASNPSKDPELKKKFDTGPIGTLNIFGGINMGQNMFWTFVFFLVVSVLLAYLGWESLGGTSPPFLRVWQIVGTAAILAYTCGAIPNDIWFKRPLWTNLIDGIVYGLVTGLIFAALWP
jgi:hypothetical protein